MRTNYTLHTTKHCTRCETISTPCTHFGLKYFTENKKYFSIWHHFKNLLGLSFLINLDVEPQYSCDTTFMVVAHILST